MSRRVKHGAFKRTCRTCGWSGTYTTAQRANYAKRRHSCEKNIRLAVRRARGVAMRAAWDEIDRTPKPCLHPEADHQHGTYACWTLDGCRCWPCKEAQAEYDAERRRLQGYGIWNGLVDAEPVREHLARLREYGIGTKHVSKLSGVSNGALTKIIYGLYASAEGPSRGRYGKGDLRRGPAQRVRPSTAERILAIEAIPANLPAVAADHERTPLARLHLRSLVALGWSMSRIGVELGMGETSKRNANTVISTDRVMTREMVDRVEELFARLSMTLPPETNQRERIAASRSRRLARERGWRVPLELEDLAANEPVETGLDEQAIWRRMQGDRSVRLTTAEAVELTQRWKAQGRSLAELERTTGINPHRHLRSQETRAS